MQYESIFFCGEMSVVVMISTCRTYRERLGHLEGRRGSDDLLELVLDRKQLRVKLDVVDSECILRMV